MALWNRPLWWINGLAVMILLATYLAPVVSPRTGWLLALLAMSYPYQLPVHAFFIGWWLLMRRKRMLISLAAVLIGWAHVGDHVQIFGRNAPAREVRGEGVKVMSWNVRLFDLYNWSHNKETRDSIFSILHREDTDILCLQEFFHSPDERFFRTKDALMKDLRYRWVHDSYSAKARLEQHFGIATFSVHPIVDRGTITFPENPSNQCIWSDIAIGKDTIRVYNAHLASYHFGDSDYRFIDGLDTDTDSETLKRGGLRILKLLRRGFLLRADEVERIADHMRSSPYPVVYCGDMNDVPMSYSYRTLRNDRRDAFRESGRGTGGTYIGKLPNLRIDHILHDNAIESWEFRTLPEELSDHRAVICRMGLAH
jgi:endonuclease/exonuclease/phosphatase family metal-dependent hydrolase